MHIWTSFTTLGLVQRTSEPLVISSHHHRHYSGLAPVKRSSSYALMVAQLRFVHARSRIISPIQFHSQLDHRYVISPVSLPGHGLARKKHCSSQEPTAAQQCVIPMRYATIFRYFGPSLTRHGAYFDSSSIPGLAWLQRRTPAAVCQWRCWGEARRLRTQGW